MKPIYLIPIIFLGACAARKPVSIPVASTIKVQESLEVLDAKLSAAGQTNAQVSKHLQNAKDAADELIRELDKLDAASTLAK